MIPGLPSVGGGELLILLVIILLLFGAKRIPELARSLGKGTHEFRKGISEGNAEGETQGEDRKESSEEKPPLDEAARGESGAEAEAAHAEQKS